MLSQPQLCGQRSQFSALLDFRLRGFLKVSEVFGAPGLDAKFHFLKPILDRPHWERYRFRSEAQPAPKMLQQKCGIFRFSHKNLISICFVCCYDSCCPSAGFCWCELFKVGPPKNAHPPPDQRVWAIYRYPFASCVCHFCWLSMVVRWFVYICFASCTAQRVCQVPGLSVNPFEGFPLANTCFSFNPAAHQPPQYPVCVSKRLSIRQVARDPTLWLVDGFSN